MLYLFQLISNEKFEVDDIFLHFPIIFKVGWVGLHRDGFGGFRNFLFCGTPKFQQNVIVISVVDSSLVFSVFFFFFVCSSCGSDGLHNLLKGNKVFFLLS